MTWWQALALGIVQGVTEFLPISSSGHLVLFQSAWGLQDSMVVFDVWLHVATLGAVVAYFWRRWLKVSWRQYWLIGVGTLPVVLVGLFLKDMIESFFGRPSLVAWALVMTGVFNAITHWWLRHRTGSDQVKLRSVVVAGLMQAVAIVPGISRSGSTVMGGLVGGLDRQRAFEWSFLLAVPAITGAAVLQFVDQWRVGQLLTVDPGVLVAAMIAAFISGLVSIGILEWVLQKAEMIWFSVYCWVVAAGFGLWWLLA